MNRRKVHGAEMMKNRTGNNNGGSFNIQNLVLKTEQGGRYASFEIGFHTADSICAAGVRGSIPPGKRATAGKGGFAQAGGLRNIYGS